MATDPTLKKGREEQSEEKGHIQRDLLNSLTLPSHDWGDKIL